MSEERLFLLWYRWRFHYDLTLHRLPWRMNLPFCKQSQWHLEMAQVTSSQVQYWFQAEGRSVQLLPVQRWRHPSFLLQVSSILYLHSPGDSPWYDLDTC